MLITASLNMDDRVQFNTEIYSHLKVLIYKYVILGGNIDAGSPKVAV